MTTSYLYEKIIMNQVKLPSVHIPLIIFDNLPIILSLIQIPSKIKDLPISFFDQTQNFISSMISTILVSIFTFMTLLYLIIQLSTRNKKHKQNHTMISSLFRSIILFYDLIMFRYFSSIILFVYADLIIKYITQSLSVILLCFTVISLICYIATMYSHINMTYIIIHIDNKEIVTNDILYPFDEFSRRFDLYMLTVKLIGGMEYIAYYINKYLDLANNASDNPIHYLTYFFNYWFIIVIFFLFFNFIIYEIILLHNVESFLLNTKFNLTRITMLFLNSYLLLLMLFLINASLSFSLIPTLIIIVISLIWSLASSAILWNRIIIPTIYNGNITIRKCAYIITQDFNTFLNSSSGDIKKDHYLLKISSVKLFNSFKINHFIHCLESKCNLCKIFHEDFSNTYAYLHLFRVLIKNDVIIQEEDNINIVISALLILLYFRFHHQPYKYYRQYQKLVFTLRITKYFKAFLTYIDIFFASYTDMNNDSNNLGLYKQITSLTELNGEVQLLLKSIKDFVSLNDEYDQYAQIIKVANEIRILKRIAGDVLEDSDGKESTVIDTNEQMTKRIKNIYHYNIVINKFIIEKLLNEPLNNSMPIEPEQLADYFNSHYHSDSFLMLNVSNSFLYKESLSSVVILKTGHTLINYDTKSFSKLFPAKLLNEANSLFVALLSHYKSTHNSNQTFDFVVNDNTTEETVSHFRYQFDLLHVLCNDSLLVYGFYTHPEKNIMLFEPYDDQSNEMILWRYSQTIQSLLPLPAKIIDAARDIEFYFTFDNLFLSVKELTHRTDDSGDKDTKFECVFDYNNYAKLLSNLQKRFDKHFSMTNHFYTEDINDAIKKTHSKTGKQINLTFKLLSDYNKIKVYSLKLSSNNFRGNDRKSTSHLDATILSKSIENISENQIMKMNNDQQSISSVADNYSMNSLSSNLNQQKKNQQQLLTLYNNLTSDNAKSTDKFKTSFKLIMTIIIIFNTIIIILCAIFLVIQIIQLKAFYSINHLYYNFKQLRILFTHIFLSIYSNVCIGDPLNDSCSNVFIDYSRRFQIEMGGTGLNTEYYLNNYISDEVKYKAILLSTLANINKNELYNSGNADLSGIFTQQMNYSQIIEKDDKLMMQRINMTFEQGLKTCINSLQIVLSNLNYVSDHPVFILTHNENSIDFSKVKNTTLDQTQKELYGLIINFLNYYNVFSQGENLLLSQVDIINALNKSVLLLSMGIIFTFNVLLLLLCLSGFKLIHKLLFGFCVEIITLLSKKDIQTFFENRIDNLLLINKLYLKNPNILISQITKAEGIQQKRKNKLLQATKSLLADAQPMISNNKKAAQFIAKTSKYCWQASYEITKDNTVKEVIKPYKKLTLGIFVYFFLFFLGFGSFVFYNYLKVLDLNSYVQSNYKFENMLYTSIGITQIMSLLSMSREDVAIEIGYNPQDLEDSILNIQTRETIVYYNTINSLEATEPSNYPHLSTLFTDSTDCHAFITEMADSNIESVSQDNKMNYTELHVQLCNKMKALTLPNFAFIYNDLLYRIESLQNSLINLTYEELELFNSSNELFDLYTITLMIFRPLRYYVKMSLLTKRVESKMNSFIWTVAIFLSVNIVMTVLIFIMIRFIIFKRLDKTNVNLRNLKQTLLM